MTKTVKIAAIVTCTATTGKSIAKQRKFTALKERALKVRGNKRKYQEMVTLYGLTEKMAVKLLTVNKL